jgi:cation transport regulator ChaC
LTDYVFGYASLVALEDVDALPGRLRGFRRRWGVAMNNWEGGEEAKHWLDRATGERPRIRVAYLDIYEQAGSAVNGLALPVDAERLVALDRREVNYERVEVTDAFAPEVGGRVFTYIGLDAARERCRRGAAEGDAFVASDYVGAVRRAFERLDSDSLPEFNRTTDPLPFPELDLQVVPPHLLDS